MLDLQFLLPQTAVHFTDVPKTIIYMDRISRICQAAERFAVWMRQLGYPSESGAWVKTYFSDMAEKDKNTIDVDFRRRHKDCSAPRIILTTDAYGLGVDNPDVQRVVQWLLPSSIQQLYQRMGRAMRCGEERALFLLLHQPWCVGDRSARAVPQVQRRRRIRNEKSPAIKEVNSTDSVNSQSTDEASEENKKGEREIRKSDGDRRRDMPTGLYDFTNVSAGQCIRACGLQFFGEKVTSSEEDKIYPCCSGCHPDQQVNIIQHETLNPTASTDPLRRPWFRASLIAWRSAKQKEITDECGYSVPAELIMSDQFLEALSKWAGVIYDLLSMIRYAGPWPESNAWGREILSILERGRQLNVDGDDIFREWKEWGDKRPRGRRRFVSHASPAPRSAADRHEENRQAWLIGKGVLSSRGHAGDRKSPGSSPTQSPARSAFSRSAASPPHSRLRLETQVSPSLSAASSIESSRNPSPRLRRQGSTPLTPTGHRVDLTPSRSGRKRKSTIRWDDEDCTG